MEENAKKGTVKQQVEALLGQVLRQLDGLANLIGGNAVAEAQLVAAKANVAAAQQIATKISN